MCGADIKGPTSRGFTPLHLAGLKGLEQVVSALLLVGVDKDAVTNEGDSALMWACVGVKGIGPSLAAVRTLLAAGADIHIRRRTGYSALDWASLQGRRFVLQALLGHGAEVNSRDAKGHSALHMAAANDQAGAVDALIEAGANIEMRSNTGQTPLAHAANRGKAKSLLVLLQQGASVGARDNWGQTPLHLACRFQPEGLEEVVDLLLRSGADKTATTVDGATMAELLGAVHERRTCSQDEVDRVRLLLSGARVDQARLAVASHAPGTRFGGKEPLLLHRAHRA